MDRETFRIIYVDEEAGDRLNYSQRLARLKTLEVAASAPPPNLELHGKGLKGADLFLIDYQLSKQKNGKRIGYQGGTLATSIRELFPEHPIVALTRKSLFEEGPFQQTRLRDLFEAIIYKGDVVQEAATWSRYLWTIAKGFKMLRGSDARTWRSLTRLLKANKREQTLLLETGRPMRKDDLTWRVIDVARWLRDVVFAYPGILYDPLHAATLYGISISAFQKKRVQRLLEPARYEGLLAPIDGLWWRDRLIRFGARLLVKHRIKESLNSGFVPAYEREYKERLRRSKCIYSGEASADTVCYILRKPVKRKFSLPYFPDDRPSVMDEARVSFKAIRESNLVRDELFGSNVQELLKKIRSSNPP